MTGNVDAKISKGYDDKALQISRVYILPFSTNLMK